MVLLISIPKALVLISEVPLFFKVGCSDLDAISLNPNDILFYIVMVGIRIDWAKSERF